MANVSFQDVRKSFGSTTVLHGLTFDIKQGEFVVLVGPSGCGKSTLLRSLAGLEELSSGEILMGGRPVTHLQSKDRDIAMVFQSYALYPHMKVRENMGFSLRLRKVDGEEISRRVEDAARVLDLTALLDRYPRELSGGQRQRVAMGRAIVRDPKVFLFDEPLSNLDAKLRVSMRAEIKALHQRLRTTTVYVTHDQIEAMTLASRIVVMRAGRVEQIGTPMEVYRKPANLFVAQFIGSPAMNIIRGVVQQEAGRNVLRSGQLTWELPDIAAASLLGREVLCGVRPSDLRVCSARSGTRAQVVVVEPTGSETEVVLSCNGSDFRLVMHETCDLVPGEVVGLQFDPEVIHFFDPSTHMRLSDV